MDFFPNFGPASQGFAFPPRLTQTNIIYMNIFPKNPLKVGIELDLVFQIVLLQGQVATRPYLSNKQCFVIHKAYIMDRK